MSVVDEILRLAALLDEENCKEQERYILIRRITRKPKTKSSRIQKKWFKRNLMLHLKGAAI